MAATYVGQALLGNATAPLGAPTPDAFSDGLLLGLDTDLNVRSQTVRRSHAKNHTMHRHWRVCGSLFITMSLYQENSSLCGLSFCMKPF